MIAIQTLPDPAPQDLRRIASGYTSARRYAVHKQEADARTTITLELEPLDPPCVKRWAYSDQECRNLADIVAEHGLSLGAFDGERLVGFAIAEPRPWNRTLWVWEVGVEVAYRGRGIGRRLLDALAARGAEAGLRVMVCETESTNVPAVRFYRKVGFALEGIDLSYYANEDMLRGEVALFMKRRLAP